MAWEENSHICLHMQLIAILSRIEVIIYAMAEKNLNRIKVMLAEKGKTNKWLAEKLGRDQATISKWCTNACQPPLEALIQISQCLEVDIQELIRVPEHNPYKEL